MTGNHKGCKNQRSDYGHQKDLELKIFIIFVLKRSQATAGSHVWKLQRKIRMQQHEQTVQDYESSNCDPNRNAEIRHHECVVFRHNTDVLCMLHKEGAEEETAQNEIEGNHSVILGKNGDS